MKTFLYGAYGTGNLGDDALLKSALNLYKDEQPKVVSYGKPLLSDEIPWIDHFEFIKNPENFLKKGNKLIFGGGGLFWTASHGDVMAQLAIKASELGCEVAIDRIGVQGVHSNIEAAKILFRLSKQSTVRDQASVDILKQLGITENVVARGDLVSFLENVSTSSHFKDAKFRVGINHSATPFFYDESHRNKTLEIYKKVATAFPDIDFYYLPHTRHFNVICQNDVIFGEYFWKATRGKITPLHFPSTVEELFKYYRGMSCVIGWRYHLLVIADLLKIPAAYLGQPGAHKYGAFAKENNLPQINFNLPVDTIVASASRFIQKTLLLNKL
jgi:polysaccharide pyruvyl transferase WcaK-like protein